MAISASQVSTSDTLEKLRQEFNKLRTDVSGLDSGTISVTNVEVQSSDFANDGFKVTLAGADLTGNKTITFPDINGTMLTNANADLGTITTSSSDADHVLVNDGGVLKRITPSDLGIAGSPAADDIGAGDANVNITTSSGQINIGPAAADEDVNIKGTDSDGNTNFIAMNVDMSQNGLVTFSDSIKIKNNGTIGNPTAADIITLNSDTTVTFKDDIKIKNGGTIGSVGGADAMSVSSGGVVTFNSAPALPSSTPYVFVTGMIIPYAGPLVNQAAALALAGNGWLLCNGDEVSASTYAALKNILLETYGSYTNGSGGSGTTHFRLPDLRGRVIAALDNMGGTSANVINEIANHANADALGSVLGDDVHQLLEAELPAHTHSDGTYQATTTRRTGSGGSGLHVSMVDAATTLPQNFDVTGTSGSTGSGNKHANMQPTMFMNYIIKT